ncbi:hypothetical protein LTS18_007361 [Coniosporium uncinatum]|uniref:Uncharacterized protein n=1 Tax=Coniosporium uncinatum TaxID=93489 RepID=A0ACC3D2Y4_9PEZI|nr:hypothetical protein LTS18_007361 [Coniosporium uncinatum]
MSALKLATPRLPPGSLILVTGCNGLIGSHIVDQLLASGYRVRGTVRNPSKDAWLTPFFSSRYSADAFELVQVADIRAPGAFDEAIKGAAGVVHTASYMDFQTQDPEAVIPPTVESITRCLEAAASEGSSVKAFVLTSSSWASKVAEPNVEDFVDENSWNDRAVKRAYGPAEQRGPTDIYSASKAEAERAAWKWVEERKPGFVLNTVLPSTTFGGILSPENQGVPSTAGFIRMFWQAQKAEDVGMAMMMVKPGWFVDVVDAARLHVAGLADEGVQDERLYGFAHEFIWDDVLKVMREMEPEGTFLGDFGMERDGVEVRTRERAEVVLKECFGTGWTSLKDSVTRNVESFTKRSVGGDAGWIGK